MKPIHPISPDAQATILRALHAGDTVWVRTTSGETAVFIVQQVEREAILAPGGVRYAGAEIAELKRRSFSGPKTAGLVAGIFGGLVVLISAAAAAALGGLYSLGASATAQ